MGMPIGKYRELSKKLYLSTSDDSLSWQIDPFDGEVSTSLGRFKLILSDGEDAEGGPYIRVSIRNQQGEEVDFFTDNMIKGPVSEISDVPTYWVLLADLQTMAHRKAKGADKALDEILLALDGDDVPF